MAKHLRMILYIDKIQELLQAFPTSTIQRVSRTKNAHADSLASLGSTLDTQFRSSIPIEYLDRPSIEEAEQLDLMWIDENPSWQDPINDYLVIENLPNDKSEAKKSIRNYEVLHEGQHASPASSTCKHLSCFAKYTMANVGTTLGADHLPRRLLAQTTSSLLYAKTPRSMFKDVIDANTINQYLAYQSRCTICIIAYDH